MSLNPPRKNPKSMKQTMYKYMFGSVTNPIGNLWWNHNFNKSQEKSTLHKHWMSIRIFQKLSRMWDVESTLRMVWHVRIKKITYFNNFPSQLLSPNLPMPQKGPLKSHFSGLVNLIKSPSIHLNGCLHPFLTN
jgi:hypothetical protein